MISSKYIKLVLKGMVTMTNDKDWNAALMGGEDWKAATGSEIFRNFVKITLAEEARENQIKAEAEARVSASIMSVEEALKATVKTASTNVEVGPNEELMNISNYEVESNDEYVARMNAEASLRDEYMLKSQGELEETNLLKTAEAELGLDKNAFYLAKLIKGE